MLLFANGHEIAQVAEFHPMPPGYRTDRKDILDVSLVVILYWPLAKATVEAGRRTEVT
jgi:hypothetical protein